MYKNLVPAFAAFMLLVCRADAQDPPPSTPDLSKGAAPLMALPAAPAQAGGAPQADRPPAASSLPTIAPPPTGAPPPADLTAQSPASAPPPQSSSPPPMLDTVNNAKFGDADQKGDVSPVILRADVMLDRLHASPGVIDGRHGTNFEHAVALYRRVKGFKTGGGLDQTVWSALTAESGGPALMTYVLTDQDVAGPFYPDLPTDYAQLATLPSLGYRSASQKIGAQFHMGEDLLAALNPGVDLSKAGTKILVADVAPTPLHETVTRIVVDKDKSQVVGYDRRGKVLVGYPATIGSEELPSPSGTYKVKGVAYNPIYYYDPKNFVQGDNKEKLKLPAGPNNPVGSVFIALTKPTYGLHGTPDPSKIDKTASHGCVRMTNWDANELAHLVKPGVVVHFSG